MSVLGDVRRGGRRLLRALTPRTDVRLLGLRKRHRRDRGQTAIEYVGLVVVVAAIVGALVGTGIGPTLAEGISNQVCRVTGGGGCGGGGQPEAQDDRATGDDDPGGDKPVNDDTGTPKSPEQIVYEKALKDLQDAQDAEKADRDKAIEAAKELAKILADELGITDALDCVIKGDMGACTETLVNVLLSLVGGAVGKLAAKYGAPWKWKKAVELVKKLKKHGGDLYDGLKGLIKNRKKVKDAEKALDDAKKKYDPNQKKPDEKKPDDKPTTCPVRHSFLPGTLVLLADGRRVPIETVRAGMRVEAADPGTGVAGGEKVTRTFTTYDDKEFTRLTVRTPSGTALVTATDTHPFWLTDERRWADAGDIRPGARLRTDIGSSLQVLTARHYVQRQTTHDLAVEGVHTYFVGVGGANALVHNNDCDMSDDEVEAARKPDVGEGDAKKFKDHFLRHKKLVEDALGTKYKKLKEDGPRFREDIAKAIKDGTFELVGKGTLKKGEPEGLIYRGKGVTVVLRENGDFWTALKSGEGMDTGIEITKKVPKKKG
jgi:hypothetical protein